MSESSDHPKRDPPRPTVENVVWLIVVVAAILGVFATFSLKFYAYGTNAARHIDAPSDERFIDYGPYRHVTTPPAD
jgi:hypothetical protein